MKYHKHLIIKVKANEDCIFKYQYDIYKNKNYINTTYSLNNAKEYIDTNYDKNYLC